MIKEQQFHSMNSQIRNKVFRAFLQQTARFPVRSFESSKTTIQSSVGMIFQANPSPSKAQDLFDTPIDDLNIFFAQRGGYIGDLNAYNIVLPGGQADIGQTDLDACKRQIFEQIGLRVDQSCLYLGQIPRNFYYRKKVNRALFMNCHVWVLKKGHQDFKPKLNPDQLIDYRWVPFQDFLKIENYSYSNQIMKGIIERSIPRKLSYFNPLISKQIKYMMVPVFNVGMDKELWGLTLFLCSFILQMGAVQLKNQNKNNDLKLSPQEEQHNNIAVTQTQKIIDRIKDIDIGFNKLFIIGYPLKIAVKIWHYNNRVLPFSYQNKVNKVKIVTYGIFFIVVFLIIACLLN